MTLLLWALIMIVALTTTLLFGMALGADREFQVRYRRGDRTAGRHRRG